MPRAAILIDGGVLRQNARRASLAYDPTFIEEFAANCWATDEAQHRILYYDCAPYNGTARLPVSGQRTNFSGSDAWLVELSHRPLIAVRRGVLKFRGFVPKRNAIPLNSPSQLQDSDFEPSFEQKGVDMRIGLDIALYSETKAVDRIILVSNDTDCVPALKYARRAGLQVIVAELPNSTPHADLKTHCDYVREVPWP